MKLPGIRVVAVELEIGWQAASEGVEALEQFGAAGCSGDGELPRAGNMDFDLVAFCQCERLDHGGRNANC